MVLNSVNIITIKINSFTKNINYSNTDNIHNSYNNIPKYKILL